MNYFGENSKRDLKGPPIYIPSPAPFQPLDLHSDFKSPADIIDYDVLAEAFSHQDAGLGGAGPGTTLSKQAAMPIQSSGGGSSGAPGPNQTSRSAFLQASTSSGSLLPQAAGGPLVHIPSPTFDYIPPHLVSLFVTDMGGYTPSYVYRLLAEFYDRNDYSLSKQMGLG